MFYELMNRFSFSYESGASASYMVIRANEGETVLDYQVEMLSSNTVYNILPFETRHKDGRVSFYYNITSKLSLSQFLKRRKLKRNEFLRILSSISRALLDCRCYLLYDRCAVIEDDFIFITPDTLDVSLAYIPIELNVNINKRFKDFMLDLIIHSADIDENTGDNFLQRIIIYLRSDTFSIKDFHRLLTELMQNDAVTRSLPQVSKPMCEDLGDVYEQTENKQSVNSKKIQKRQDLSSGQVNPLLVPPSQRSDTQEVKKDKYFDFEIKSIPMAAALALQVFIIVLIVLGRSFLNSLSDNAAGTYSGVALVILAIEALAFKKLFGVTNTEKTKDHAVKVPQAIKSLNSENSDVWSMTGHLEQDHGRDSVEAPVKKPVVMSQAEEIKRKGHSDHGDENMNASLKQGENMQRSNISENDTDLLEQKEGKYAYLQYENDGLVERIPITKKDFVIGRLKGQVDHILSNSAVGKMHAEVICKDCSYYIKDLNSRNGTFINALRVNSSTEYEIRNGDKITLANIECTFVTP